MELDGEYILGFKIHFPGHCELICKFIVYTSGMRTVFGMEVY